MFVYLSKRIAIPNGTVITSISWNEELGWLACGGEAGLLKVLRVDGGLIGQKAGGLTANQTLEGHEGSVNHVVWNNIYRKLASCDEKGKITIWTFHKGMWFEEMVNNRNKSSVVDLNWSVDGGKICIAYEDGTVIVGGVDGNRLWGNELHYDLTKVCWSSDDRFLIFGSKKGEVFIHDASGGQYVSQINIVCDPGDATLAGITWHPAWVDNPEPLSTFAICYSSGKMQLTSGLNDEKPYIIDTGVPIQYLTWNPQGTILAICGITSIENNDSPVILVQFFDTEGVHLRSLRVNGKRCGGLTWEGDGLRVAIAVDSSVYFANVRPRYKYCYFSDTLVYSYPRPETVEESVVLWNVKNNERVTKHVRHLAYLASCEEACVIVSKPEKDSQQSRCMVQLVNAIGNPLETRFVDLEPTVCGINSAHVVCCGEENIYIWQFRDPSVIVDALDPISMQASGKETQERIIHIDDLIRPQMESTLTMRSALTNDLISAVCLSEEFMFVARESGALHVYRLDPLQLMGKLILPTRVQTMYPNCDSTLLAVVDLSGVLRIFAIERDKLSLMPRKAVPHSNYERKDVWNVCWASDDPESLALMEKTRMYIVKNFEAEQPITSCAHLCQFKALSVRSALLDELLQDPERPRKDYLSDMETKELRDAREVLSTSPLKDAVRYIEDHSHPRLWALLVEHALTALEFSYAETAAIRCCDYPTIQFVKRVKTLDDPKKQEAEIHAYYSRFDEAEKIYKDIDRKDLALNLRYRLGDWFNVVRLVQEGGGDESYMVKAWENIGDQYADRQKWTKAAHYYMQCRNYRKLAHVYYLMEDLEMLSQLTFMVGHDKELLVTLGDMLLTMGFAEEAAEAYLMAGEVRMAVDGCLQVNLWEKAVELAAKHQLDDVGQLLRKYAAYLIQRERLPEAIELYRKAGQNDEAAKLLARLGQSAALQDPLKAKKFYLLSALEVEKYRAKRMELKKDGAEAVEELLNADRDTTASDRSLNAAWRGAEAFHFFLMCQQLIVEKNLYSALVVAMRLMDYDDLISPVDAYSLIALTAYLAGNYAICSRAFMRLEEAERNDENQGADRAQISALDFSMDLDVTNKTIGRKPGAHSATLAPSSTLMSGTTTSLLQLTSKGAAASITEFTYPTVSLNEPKRRFADLAVQIFTRRVPKDTSVDNVKCSQCGTLNKEWSNYCISCQLPFTPCIVSGRSITTEDSSWKCTVCRHSAFETEIDRFYNCPLCHTPRKQRQRRQL